MKVIREMMEKLQEQKITIVTALTSLIRNHINTGLTEKGNRVTFFSVFAKEKR
jgi:hypothetical protein